MAYKFSPNMASAEERRKTFVARQPILEDLLNRVKMDLGARHCILIGPRGIGKTHLLLLLADTIEADKELSAKWLVIRFAEEEYGISTLAEIFQRVVDKIPNIKSENLGRDADLALAYIQDYCEKEKKRILLLMDNMHLYFEQLNDVDIGKLRDILMSRAIFLIIGAAPSYFKQMVGYEEAFYNFFEPIHLGELKQEDAENLLLCRAEFDNKMEFIDNFDQCRPKIATANRLTGGNPRLLLMLYKVMCESSFSDSTEAFKMLLDELTPFFQARMETLSAQERKVMDTLAFMEEPATPTELAKATGLSTGSISTPIRRLEDRGYIRKVKLQRSRGTRYEVTERLFRIWREMRSESGKTRFGFIIRFLDLWYSPKDILSESMRLLSELPKVEDIERQDLLLRLDYLKEASPETMKMDLERIYSYAETNRFEFVEAHIKPLRDSAEIEERIRKSPDDASAWTIHAMTFMIQDKLEEALESCDKAVKLDPNDANAWVIRAGILAKLKRKNESIKSLNKANKLGTDDAVIQNNFGVAFKELDRYEEALKSYDKAIEINPDYAEAWSNRGVVLNDLGRYEEALKSYDRAIQLKPDFAEAWYNQGVVLGDLGRYEEALKSYDGAIQLKPDYAEAWYNQGVVLGNLGRYEEALKSYDRAIQLKPDYAEAWNNQGVTLSILGRYEEAFESSNKAIQLKPDYAEILCVRGIALGELGRYNEALESYDRAIRLKSDFAEAWYYRGVVLRRLVKDEEAFKSYDRAVQLKPDYAEAWLLRGLLLSVLGRYEEALKSFNKVIQIKPDDVEAWYYRGRILELDGGYNEALESYDKAIQLKHDYAMAWLNRGIALSRIGRHEEALENIKEAEKLAKEQGLENVPQFSAVMLIEASFMDSLKSLRENNIGLANNYLMDALKSSKQANEDDLPLLIFAYIKSAIEIGKLEFAQSAIGRIVSELGEDYDQLLQPFKIAINYMQTGDVEILERLQQEEREIVQEIVKLRDSKQS
jgi:tetratricopeptide (TPR) repeat protein